MRYFTLFSATCTLAWAALTSSAQAADEHLVIEALQGDGVVLVYSGQDNQPHPAEKGARVAYWDVIQTSKLSAVKLRYADGSVVVVGRDTKFTVQPRQGGTQFNQLEWGSVRAQVEKAKTPDHKAPPRFVIRTRSAVMGVRGTDFVAGYDAGTGQSALHTIEGTVDIGVSDKQVMSWQGAPVSAGHQAVLSTTPAPPQLTEFVPRAYQAQVQAAQPELVALADKRGGDGTFDHPGEAGVSRLDELSVADRPPLQLLSFRVGDASIYQAGGLRYSSPNLEWSPTYRLNDWLTLRGVAGGFLGKVSGAPGTIYILQAGALLDVTAFGAIHIEGGAGAERWALTGTGDPNADGSTITYALMGNVVWHFAPRSWLNSVYAGVSRPGFSGKDTTDLGSPVDFKAGVGLRF